jgi:hypothetical protein
MTGRRYYITTLADWHRHAHRFANSHWLALSNDNEPDRDADDWSVATVGTRQAVPEHADGKAAPFSRELADASRAVPNAPANTSAPDAQPPGVPFAHDAQPSDATRIIVLVDADEGVHLALDDDPSFISKLVIDDASGRPVCASLARITCEMYLVADPDAGTPRERYARILALHDAGARDLLSRGLDDAHAWLPPPIARRFGRRLEALGWIHDDAWTPYCRRLKK